MIARILAALLSYSNCTAIQQAVKMHPQAAQTNRLVRELGVHNAANDGQVVRGCKGVSGNMFHEVAYLCD